MLPTGDVAALVHAQYAACGFNPSNGQYTVLAAFLLESSLPTINSITHGLSGVNKFKVASLATGSKCLPTARFPPGGDALHDSHAEVLARRGLVRWLHEEVQRALHTASGSEWIEQRLDGKWTLRGGGKLHMYISTVPCGDASMRFLASSQDPAMAALKDSAPPVALPPGTASRGRNNYSLYGVLRTKPGRADSPPTLCMSCSDKIASWNVLGVQGALAARIFAPIYMSSVTLGGVPEDMRNMVREDCERAFCQRLQEIKELPVGFLLAQPTLHFTRADFIHSRAVLHALLLQKSLPSSSNESFCWFADSPVRQEVIINGTRRGVGEKQRGIEKFRPSLCKLQLYRLHEETARMLAIPWGPSGMSYHDAKQSDVAFQAARSALKGPNGPFVGWVVSGKPWESFDVEGNIFYAPMNSEETLPSS